MEIPFDVDEDFAVIGNTRLCLRNRLVDSQGIPMAQRRSAFAILSSRLVADTLDDGSSPTVVRMYKQQLAVSRILFHQDSVQLMHGAGTGKTETSQFAMMNLLASGLITRILIVNTSRNHNIKAKKTFRTLWELNNRGVFGNAFKHLTFDAFLKEHVCFNTYSVLKTTLVNDKVDPSELTNYGDQMDIPRDGYGIIFDEAHNLVSERETIMRTFSRKLVDILANCRGTKVIFSSATPIVNDVSGFQVIKSLLLRTNDVDVGRTEDALGGLPGELISYKEACYDHLKITQMFNESDPLEGIVNISDDPDIQAQAYPLRVFRMKPQRYQLVDILEYLIAIDYEKSSKATGFSAVSIVEFNKFSVASEPGIINVDESSNERYGFFLGTTCGKKGNRFKSSTVSQPSSPQSPVDSSNALFENSSDIGQPPSSTATSFTGEREVVDSCIAEQIVDQVEKSKDGVAIVYLFLNETGSKTICACLESRGYERYTGEKKASNSSKKRAYLEYDSNSSEKHRRLFEDAKKPENWDGSIVKVIVGSRAMRDGVDIHHVTQIHIALPEWHVPGLIQAWHRGIRSNGHNSLIYHRALELSRRENITMEEARKRIKIEYKVYNYVIDLTNLTDQELEGARNRFRKLSNRKLTNDQIRQIVKRRDFSLREIQTALKKYIEVGKLMECLKKHSIDYYVNNGTTAELPVQQREPEYVFADVSRALAKKQITTAMGKHHEMTIDKLVDTCLKCQRFLSRDDILDTLAHLVHNDFLLFVDSLGYTMRLVVHNKDVLLVSSIANPSQTLASHTTKMNSIRQLTFQIPSIQQDDLKITAVREVNTINKLKKTLEDALTQDGRNFTSGDLTVSFLRHMTNFWGPASQDLAIRGASPDGGEYSGVLNLYVLGRHVNKCSIHVRRCIKGVLTFSKMPTENASQPNSPLAPIVRWVQAKSSHCQDIEVVRPISLVERYEVFDFREIPEIVNFFNQQNTQTSRTFDWFSYQPRTNGIIMLKKIPKEPREETVPKEPRGEMVSWSSFVDAYLDKLVDFGSLDNRLISVKKFGDQRSKGRQLALVDGDIRSDDARTGERELSVRAKLLEELTSGIYFVFFPYETPIWEDKTDTSLLNSLLNLKRRELADKQNAEMGRPCWKHRLLAVEYLATIGEITLDRKEAIYQAIWRKKDTR